MNLHITWVGCMVISFVGCLFNAFLWSTRSEGNWDITTPLIMLGFVILSIIIPVSIAIGHFLR